METASFEGRLSNLRGMVAAFSEFSHPQRAQVDLLIKEYIALNTEVFSTETIEVTKLVRVCLPVQTLRKYDIVYGAFQIEPPHYHVVIGMDTHYAYVMPITTKLNFGVHQLTANRAFANSYLSETIVRVPIKEARKAFCFNYSEGRKQLKGFIEMAIKKYYSFINK